MRRIDARMLRDLLRQDGYAVGRKHVATLMRIMGIEALYRKANTSRWHPAQRIYTPAAAAQETASRKTA